MGGLSLTHLFIILIILLLFFGPSRLEGLGSSMGKAIRGFKEGIDGDKDKKKDDEKKEEGPPRQIEHLSAKDEKDKDKV